ncbi:aldehyde dehydrogenase family 3 member B3 isoform X2 [Octodon degus]|uniref:Aldehyde dehydrogenase family 3 member B3 isoform X2 n=1 Tax=Octodon degus TaxID=10160 RepID=A0A6P6E2F9_OCTDE|nr:aldehyde dehydrogenase family 3 member B3 isoform X2 [Octodon degus]
MSNKCATKGADPEPMLGTEPFEDTVQRLREAFKSGRTRPAAFREEQLEALGRFLREKQELLYEALAQDLQKSPLNSDISEIILCQNEVDLALKNLKTWMKDKPASNNLLTKLDSAFTRKEPLGLVLIIAPWNYPVNLTLVPLIGAIAAGNCVILKPPEISKRIEKVLTEVLPQYLDQSCFAVVPGGPEESQKMLQHKFDHIFFTGSARVGKIVMAAAAKHLTPVTLELGGKNPCYVDDNCDPQTVANRLAWFRYFNTGQTCVAPDYVLCSQEMQERLVPALQNAITRFYGDDPRSSPDLGRIISQRHFKRLHELLSCGRVVIGGQSDEDDLYIGSKPGAGPDQQRQLRRQRWLPVHDSAISAIRRSWEKWNGQVPWQVLLRHLLQPPCLSACSLGPGEAQ